MDWDSSVGIATRYGPSGLKRGSAAERLLGWRVRIPPGEWMFVLCMLYNKDKRQKCMTIKTKEKVKTE
jgi:hypothetical protein